MVAFGMQYQRNCKGNIFKNMDNNWHNFFCQSPVSTFVSLHHSCFFSLAEGPSGSLPYFVVCQNTGIFLISLSFAARDQIMPIVIYK